jgi:hypothetical protein
MGISVVPECLLACQSRAAVQTVPGVTTIPETIAGMGALYGMSPDLAGVLAAYAVIFDGDPVSGTWSIGGPPTSNPLTTSILGQGQGISYRHNIYEGDSSIARGGENPNLPNS